MPPIETPATCAAEMPEVVQQADGVLGHVRERVRRAGATGECLDDVGPPDPMLAQLRRTTGVAVVVADDEEPVVGQAGAELAVPPTHRAAEAHDQQDGGIVRRTERLVTELDARLQVGELFAAAQPRELTSRSRRVSTS